VQVELLKHETTIDHFKERSNDDPLTEANATPKKIDRLKSTSEVPMVMMMMFIRLFLQHRRHPAYLTSG
jgi:transposase